MHHMRRSLLLASQAIRANHGSAVRSVSSGSLYVWGAGDCGAMGFQAEVDNPKPIPHPISEQVSVLGCGYCSTLAAEANTNKVWVNGLNSTAQLGLPVDDSEAEREETGFKDIVHSPVLIHLPLTDPNTKILSLESGRLHSMVLTDNEGVFVSGGNPMGQCGLGKENKANGFRKLEGTEGSIIQISCGMDHSLMLSKTGEVFSCGWGADGQTGQGHYNNQLTVNKVSGLENVHVISIATKVDCSFAVTDKGEVYSWGNSEYAQLAVDTEELQVCEPTKAALLSETVERVAQVAPGGSMTHVLSESGDVYSWGYGVLGHGSRISYLKKPKKLERFTDEKITRLVSGMDHTIALTETGKLFTWGCGSFGRLGLGNTENQWTPTQVPLPASVLQVHCGIDHTAALLAA